MHEAPDLKSLIYDTTSGAREIAHQSLQLLQRVATQSLATTAEELLDELADQGLKVIRGHPEMAPVLGSLNRFLLEAERLAELELGEARIQTLALLQAQQRRLDESLARSAEHCAGLIQNGDVVLTYSRSSTVLAGLRKAREEGKLFDVVVAESRPTLEGRTLAKELSELQVPVRFLVDALLATAADGADRILVGADALTPSQVLNKAGTRLLALAAKDRAVPLHVVADTGKAWLRKSDPTAALLSGKVRDPREVWDAAPYGVEVVNLYFELTPLELFASVICEEGSLPPVAFWEQVRAPGYAARIRRGLGDDLM